MELNILSILLGIIALLIGSLSTFRFGGVAIGRIALPLGAILIILGVILTLAHIGLSI